MINAVHQDHIPDLVPANRTPFLHFSSANANIAIPYNGYRVE